MPFVAVDSKELAKLAEDFAAQLQEEVFSPADIQGFLLTKKTDPYGALRDVGKWRDEQLGAKKSGYKMVDPKDAQPVPRPDTHGSHSHHSRHHGAHL